MKIAVVGRPNTGKSTFINTLAQAERMIVSERPGTTRDSVDVRFELDGLPFLAIDTAGVKRKAKIRDNLDFYSVHRAERSIRRADVVLLFLDPTQGITRLDKQLADYIAQQYKPCIFAVNKWDLMVERPATTRSQGNMGRFANLVQHAFRTMSYMPMAFITAKTGKNVKALLNLSQSMYKQAQKRVGTGTLNRVLREAVDAHPPASRENRNAADLLRHPGRASRRRRSSCSSTAPSSSTRPISATCSTSSARSCRSTTSRSSSTCAPASRRSRGAAPPAAGRRRPTRSKSPMGSGELEQSSPRRTRPRPATRRRGSSITRSTSSWPTWTAEIESPPARRIGRRRGRPDPEQRHAGCGLYPRARSRSRGWRGRRTRADLRADSIDRRGASTMAQDPVCGMDVQPEQAAGQSEYQGRTFYFCCHGLQGEVRQGAAAIRPARVGDGGRRES